MGDVEIRESYGAIAEVYVSLFGAIEHVHEDDLDLIRRHLGKQAGRVLDLGCGPGHLTKYLHELGVSVNGVDLVPEFVCHARTHSPDIHFTVGTLQTVGLPGDGWSGILAWYSLIHLPPADLDKAFADLRQVMADDGILVTGCFTGADVGPFDHKVLTAYRWPVDELVRRLARAGFVELERLERPADGAVRSHAAVVARAV